MILANQSLMRTPGAVAVEELGLVTRRRIASRSTTLDEKGAGCL